MVKQWSSVKDISSSICHNFERVNDLFQKTPEQENLEINDLFKKPTAKPPTSHKIAVGASVIAIVLSVLSLSLASSVRQSVLNTPQAQVESEAITKTVQQPIQANGSTKAKPSRQVRTNSPLPTRSATKKTAAVKRPEPKMMMELAGNPRTTKHQPKPAKVQYRKKKPVHKIKLRKRGYSPRL